jgi:hypothetical protein
VDADELRQFLRQAQDCQELGGRGRLFGEFDEQINVAERVIIPPGDGPEQAHALDSSCTEKIKDSVAFPVEQLAM